MNNHIAYRGEAQTEAEILSRLDKPYETGIVAVDTETISLVDQTCIGIGLGIGENEGIYLQVLPEQSPFIPHVLKLLANTNVTKIYHNGNFDLDVLDTLADKLGLPCVDDSNIHDSSIMAQVQGLPAALQTLGQTLLGDYDLFSIKELLEEYAPKRGGNMLQVPFDKVALKCLNDVRTTWRLYHLLQNWPNAGTKDCYETDLALIPVLRKISKKGLKLNPDVLRKHERRLSTDVQFYKELCEELNFNPASNQQVAYVLASRGNILPFTNRSMKNLKVDEEVLEGLDDPLAGNVLSFRRANKLLSTYVRPYLGHDRAYSHFRLDLATGRLASKGNDFHDHACGNQQNIPPSMRDIFEPDSNIFTNSDASQLEYRIFGYMSKDPVIMQTYADGGDIHWSTQQAISPSTDRHDEVARLNAKTFNFATVFFGTAKTVSLHTKLPVDLCQYHMNTLYELYNVGFQWASDIRSMDMPYVETDFGRRCRLPSAVERGQAHVDKCKVSYIIQGTGADIIKRSMLLLDKNGYDLRLQVHDEFLIDGFVNMPEELSYIHPNLFIPFDTKHVAIWH